MAAPFGCSPSATSAARQCGRRPRLGSGVLYITLKLASIVGGPGKVIAVDVRKLSLLFLRVRGFLHNEHNVEIIVGDPDDPHSLPGTADAVLICNTYHEFRNQRLMLDTHSGSFAPVAA